MTDPSLTRPLLWALAVLIAAGCSTAAESGAAPPGLAVEAEPAAEPAPQGPAECVADKDCMRTDCCGVGDGCAPAPEGQACADSACPKSVWSVCRCEASRCTGVFWDPTSGTPRPKEFAGW
jgi:hypothetical protein